MRTERSSYCAEASNWPTRYRSASAGQPKHRGTWRTIDAELAALIHDSFADTQAALMRSSDDIRSLTFESPRVTVEVELSGDRSLTGQIVPPQSAKIDLQHGGEVIASTAADQVGIFFLDDLPSGPISLVCRAVDEPPSWVIRTEWVMP